MLPGEVTDVLVKMLKNDSRPADRLLLVEEAVSRKPLSHRHIVNLLGVFTKSSPNFIMDEYYPGDLKVFLKEAAPETDSASTISMAEQMSIALEICDGLCYLDAMRFVHKGPRRAACVSRLTRAQILRVAPSTATLCRA